jgi:hypothetical protein
MLRCNQDEAQTLLEIANQHCAEAAQQVEDGIRKSTQAG